MKLCFFDTKHTALRALASALVVKDTVNRSCESEPEDFHTLSPSYALSTMPKATTPKSTSKTDVKPYPESSSSDIDPSPTKSTSTKSPSRVKSAPWTDQERLVLVKIAISKGASAKNFEGVLEGRTAHLCYCQW